MAKIFSLALIGVGAFLALDAAAVSTNVVYDPFGLDEHGIGFEVDFDFVPDNVLSEAEAEADVEAEPEFEAPGRARGTRQVADPVTSLCAEIDEKLTSVGFTECVERDLLPSGALSNRSKIIAVRDFPPATGESAGRVLLVGGIHGDEYSSVTAVFKWLRKLERRQGGSFYWRVVPLLNPDGLLMPPDESQRMNANGVDLNRNFPTPNWETEAMDYWVNRTRKSKRRYPGPSPLSEPESEWLAQQIEDYQPDAVISVHAPHGIVDFDGPRIPPDNLGPLELRLLGTYPGSMGRYIGVYKGIPLLTIELESAMKLPDSNDMDGIWFDMIDWLSAKIVNSPERYATGEESAEGLQRMSHGPQESRGGP